MLKQQTCLQHHWNWTVAQQLTHQTADSSQAVTAVSGATCGSNKHFTNRVASFFKSRHSVFLRYQLQVLKNRRVRSCICEQFLTFMLWIYILLQVVLFLSFRADEKKQKARHRVSKFAPSSCSWVASNIIRPLLARRYYLNVSNQGMGELALHTHPSSR